MKSVRHIEQENLPRFTHEAKEVSAEDLLLDAVRDMTRRFTKGKRVTDETCRQIIRCLCSFEKSGNNSIKTMSKLLGLPYPKVGNQVNLLSYFEMIERVPGIGMEKEYRITKIGKEFIDGLV